MTATAAEPRAMVPALTGLRGLAAWFVVLFHIRTGAQSQLPPLAMDILGKGYVAVDLFFMLSGFVLWLNYGAALRRSGLAGTPSFLARRIARIWPLHLFILAATVGYALVRELTGRANPGHYPWSELPLHLLLAHNWGFTQALTWNDPSWSISCEFAAYLLFPLLAISMDWSRLPSWAASLLLLILALTLGFVMRDAASLGDDIPRFGLARALVEFAMGTLLCALWIRWRERPGPVLLGCAGLIGVLTTTAVAGLAREPIAVPLILAALLLAVAVTGSSPGNPLAWRWVHYLGEISYSTYLVHFLLYILFKLVLVEDPDLVPLPLLGLFLLLVLAASIALHHGLERPAQRALNRAFDSLRAPPRTAAESG